jgi:DNA-binding NarL/FixJ family response regulator
MGTVLSALKTVPDAEVVGVIPDRNDISVGVREINPDVLLIRTNTFAPELLGITSELRAASLLSGIVAIVDGVVDNAGVISLLKSGVNAILSTDASTEDFGTAIREASGNRLFLPPRRRDGS